MHRYILLYSVMGDIENAPRIISNQTSIIQTPSQGIIEQTVKRNRQTKINASSSVDPSPHLYPFVSTGMSSLAYS